MGFFKKTADEEAAPEIITDGTHFALRRLHPRRGVQLWSVEFGWCFHDEGCARYCWTKDVEHLKKWLYRMQISGK